MFFRNAAASLVICASCYASATAYAGALHVISIADSNDATIGAGAAANSGGLKDYATVVSNIAKLSLDFVEIRGNSYSCTAITKAVQKLQAKSDDVIVFYYSGHGFAPPHEPGHPGIPVQSKYPWFYCSPPTARPSLEAISRELAKKGARLTITVADACNVVIPVVEAPLVAKGAIEERIRAMFLGFKGNILITSSKRGEYSWYYPAGGVFTSKFLRVLRAPPQREPAMLWHGALAELREKIVISWQTGKVEQTPEAPLPADLVFLGER